MRSRTRAAWTGSALAIALCAVAHAQPKKKKPPDVNVTACIHYSQRQDDGGVDIALRSECAANLECSVTWMLRCDGDSASDKRQEARAFALPAGTSGGAYASADACGDQGWSITKVRWSCRGSE